MKTQKNSTIVVDKEEYEALVQAVQVTQEYLQGKSQGFSSPEELIENLKKL